MLRWMGQQSGGAGTHSSSHRAPATITTIPSSDRAFRELVVQAIGSVSAPERLEARLRGLFPRVVVRERDISGEPPGWYVYRDGAWRPPNEAPWWIAPDLPRVVLSAEGWLLEANPLALSLLGLGSRDVGARHFTDLIAAGTLQDALALFDIVRSGHDLDATIVLRPTTGDLIAVDVHASIVDLGIEAQLRLADDVELTAVAVQLDMPDLECLPERDVAFRAYTHLALSRMPEPTTEGLALRLRRLYPHAHVSAEGTHWTATRDPDGSAEAMDAWWRDKSLARVVYDAQGLHPGSQWSGCLAARESDGRALLAGVRDPGIHRAGVGHARDPGRCGSRRIPVPDARPEWRARRIRLVHRGRRRALRDGDSAPLTEHLV